MLPDWSAQVADTVVSGTCSVEVDDVSLEQWLRSQLEHHAGCHRTRGDVVD